MNNLVACSVQQTLHSTGLAFNKPCEVADLVLLTSESGNCLSAHFNGCVPIARFSLGLSMSAK